MSEEFNPLDDKVVATSVLNALLASEPIRMDELAPFSGAGIYALYYRGRFPAYRLLAEANAEDCTVPIYVGKAVPDGGRKGANVADGAASRALAKRLIGDHAASIEMAENLSLDDFYARWIVVRPVWIGLSESMMISRFAPVWNNIVDGFGNHAPGSGRAKSQLSRWDTLHPGRWSKSRGSSVKRYWRDVYQPRQESEAAIKRDVETYLAQRLP